MRTRALLLSVALTVPCHALDIAANAPAVESTPFRVILPFDGEPIAITDTVVIPYTIVSRVPLEIERPDWATALPEELEVVNTERVTRSLTAVSLPGQEMPAGLNAIEFRLEIMALAPGVYTIDPIEFRAILPGDTEEVFSVSSEAVTVTIESILADDDTDLADIKGPLAPPPDYMKIALIAGGSVLALGLLIAGAAVIARRRPDAPAPPPVPAHETALAELNRLLASDLITTRRWLPYFGELSAILCRYIERRFDVHAPTQTTEEFLRDPRLQHLFDPSHERLLRAFLLNADTVKFAEGATDATQAEDAAERVRSFIEETKQVGITP